MFFQLNFVAGEPQRVAVANDIGTECVKLYHLMQLMLLLWLLLMLKQFLLPQLCYCKRYI